jgi:MurNAc alpha-1-phosphate uridylyltransferase
MKTAMIFAAGRGERLRPITDVRPKAMCKINNIPLIEYHVTNLSKAGFERLVINHAHLGGQIRQYLGNGERFNIEICYSPEPPGALETLGGIINALPLLGNEPFLTVNADIFTDYNFAKLKLPKKSLLHLVLVEKPDYSQNGDFGLTKSDHIDNLNKTCTFSGIACYSPKLFHNIKLVRASITPLLRHVALNNEATGEFYNGKWFDIGTEERLNLVDYVVSTRVC